MNANKINPADLIVGAQVIYHKEDAELAEVISILPDALVIMLNGDVDLQLTVSFKYVRPIPITPERLEEMGFIFNQRRCYWYRDSEHKYPHNYNVTLWNTNYLLHQNELINPKAALATISGIHHLQLLWKGLTGELLKIKS